MEALYRPTRSRRKAIFFLSFSQSLQIVSLVVAWFRLRNIGGIIENIHHNISVRNILIFESPYAPLGGHYRLWVRRRSEISEPTSSPSLRAKRSNPGAAHRRPWIASSQELLAMTGEASPSSRFGSYWASPKPGHDAGAANVSRRPFHPRDQPQAGTNSQ
jgi:hypothetical protein